MGNWRTSLGGLMGAVSVGLISSPTPWVHFAGLGMGMAASVWFGYHAEDKKTALNFHPVEWVKSRRKAKKAQAEAPPPRLDPATLPPPIPIKGGSFVEIHMDKDFGEIGPVLGKFNRIIQITDLPYTLAIKYLNGKRFDWEVIPYQWRYNLEIHKFHAATWQEIKKHLKAIDGA